MTAGLGSTALAMAVVAAGGAAVVGRRPGRTAVIGLAVSFGLLTVSLAALAWAMVTLDLSLVYVADYASRATSGPYRLAGVWGGMAGSLLFWTWLLAAVSVVAARRQPQTVPVLGALTAAFATIGFLVANPFRTLDLPAIDGGGLTPILRHPAMLYHPPIVYAGLVALAVPFALAVAGLAGAHPDSGSLDEGWLRATRSWAIGAWVLLTAGLVAGAHWAFVELGWGGYWGWDPVENGALVPWLGATALVHAALPGRPLSARRGTAALAVLAFLLAVAGATLARSGAVTSVHAFAEARAVGRSIAAVLTVAALVAAAVLVRHRRRAPPKRRPRTAREWAIAANTTVLLSAAVVVLAGTAAPLLSDGRGATAGSFFARFAFPPALAALALAGIGPLLPDTRTLLPGGLAAAAALLAATALGVREPPALALFAVAAATAALAIRRPGRHTVAHLGLAVLFAGIAGSTLGSERTTVLLPGQSMSVGGYQLRFDRLDVRRQADRVERKAAIDVRRGSDALGTLRPRQDLYAERPRPLAEVALRSTPAADLLVAIRRVDSDGGVLVQATVVPMAMWLWWGGALLVAGGLVAGGLLALRPRRPARRARPTDSARPPAARPASSRAGVPPSPEERAPVGGRAADGQPARDRIPERAQDPAPAGP